MPFSSIYHPEQLLLSKIISNSSCFTETYSEGTNSPKNLHQHMIFSSSGLTQHFSVSSFTAKTTRTQKSQKLCKTMLLFFFLLQHICLYGSPVSHCLLCLVIIIGTAILSTLNYFTLFLKEKLCNRKGILLYLSPPC